MSPSTAYFTPTIAAKIAKVSKKFRLASPKCLMHLTLLNDLPSDRFSNAFRRLNGRGRGGYELLQQRNVFRKRRKPARNDGVDDLKALLSKVVVPAELLLSASDLNEQRSQQLRDLVRLARTKSPSNSALEIRHVVHMHISQD